MSSIRVVLALVVAIDLELEQLDVRKARLLTWRFRRRYIWNNQKDFLKRVKKMWYGG